MNQQNYQICDANYDPLLRQFMREDGHVETIAPLEGKVFLFLLENTGECIERGLIFDRCWGDVIVSEQALTNVISKLRKTLNRVTCGCATIRTVSKMGYSLEIEESSQPQNTEPKATVPEADIVSESPQTIGLSQAELNPSSITTNQTQTSGESPEKKPQDEQAHVMPASVTQSVEGDMEMPLSTVSPRGSVNAVPPSFKLFVHRHLACVGYFLAFTCVLISLFNIFQAYYQPLPYFVDKNEYHDSFVDETNHYFFHIVRNEAYSLPAITERLIQVIPSHCNVDVFVRIYPSVNQPENDALYMLIERKDGEALNYLSSIFEVESSFDSFVNYMAQRSYFCE
ncbi:transcriptional regulator [Vibrio sp. 1F263]|uniref:winged helix-turn-helix domain-containing protein n=1 Tax=Vibrio sp. 1F263 TaxID=3230012 RepID=UPI00352F3867